LTDSEVLKSEVEKKYRCPACRHTGRPTYLKAVAGMSPGKKDYSDKPLCPRCMNEFLWRSVTQMTEE
jgi:rubredoxin